MTPPAFPRWLLRRAAPPEDRAALIGDLDEEFCTRSANYGGKASAWYWRQALASVPSALRLRWQRAAPTSDVTGDLRRALRTIRRQPGFAVAAIGTMALGSGITTAVVSIAEAILIRPLPYANAERVLVIEEHDLTRRGRGFSWPDFVELSAGRQTVSNLAGFSGGSRTLTGLGSVERLPAIEVTPQFFDVLGVEPALGRDFAEADAGTGAARVVILSDRSWRLRFDGDPAAVGRSIVLNGEPHTVVGVLPRAFLFPPRADPELWLPHRPSRAQQERAYLHYLDVIAVRRPGVTVAAVREDLRAQSYAWQHGGNPAHTSTTLGATDLRADMVAGVRPALFVLLGAGFLVLAASAINVSGLVLARAAARTREVAVRTALGASRWRIARQLGVEALCIAIAGSALATWQELTIAAPPAPATPAAPAAGGPGGGQAAAQPLVTSGVRWIVVPTSSGLTTLKVGDANGSPALERGWTGSVASPATPIVVNGVIFALASGRAAMPAVLHAFDGKTGKSLWTSGKTMKSAAAPDSFWSALSQIYVGGTDGTLHAFGFLDERR